MLVPTLGGNNGDVSTITNTGLVLGFAETALHDDTCIAPEVLGFEAFLWDPDENKIRALRPLSGDTATAAFGINEHGNVAGTSGICGNGLVGTSALHAVMWKNGLPIDLGSFGGSYANLANSINNLDQVVGVSDLIGDTTTHAFLWTEGQGIQDLGTLLGHFSSAGNDINDNGQVVDQSCDVNFNCRAVIWEHGAITDLNTLIPASSPLLLVFASAINSRGEIVGAALDQSTGATVPFLATPCDEAPNDAKGCENTTQSAAGVSAQSMVVLPEGLRKQLQQRLSFGRFGTRSIRPQ